MPRLVLKELGLALFFVQIGFETGQSFVESLDYQVIFYAIYAVLLAVIPMAASFLFGHFFLKISVSECFGVICGGITFTPGLNVIAETDSSERPNRGLFVGLPGCPDPGHCTCSDHVRLHRGTASRLMTIRASCDTLKRDRNGTIRQ